MSMYHLVFGSEGPAIRGALLLKLLELEHVGRFRDAWVERGEDGKPVIAVYTRNGGGNREQCWRLEDIPVPQTANSPACNCAACMANHVLPAHPAWIRGADDEFDSTYRTEYFAVPDEHAVELAKVAEEPVNMSEKWLKAIDAIWPKTP
jgi:hypothetical protein